MKLLLFWLLYIAWTSASIPKHIHRRLKNAHSFHDVLDSIHVIYHPEKTNRHVHKVFPTEGPRQEVRIMSGSVMKSRARNMGKMLMAQPMMQNSDIDDHTADHLTLFGEIRQGNDTCQLQSVCVPIPIENEDPQIVIYPKCYEVMQCVGSCCESYEKCHPHSIRKVIKPIIELVYVGNDRFMLNKTMNITMEEHTSCSCYDCGPKAPSCPAGYSLGSNCKCECANYGERNNCVGTVELGQHDPDNKPYENIPPINDDKQARVLVNISTPRFPKEDFYRKRKFGMQNKLNRKTKPY